MLQGAANESILFSCARILICNVCSTLTPNMYPPESSLDEICISRSTFVDREYDEPWTY